MTLTPTSLATAASNDLALPHNFGTLMGSQKVNAILDLPDPPAFVAALAPDELYLLVHDIGANDALEILQMSTVEQRITCVDLDVWNKDIFIPDELDEWLDVLSEAGRDLLVETVKALDPELVVAYLLSHIVAIVDRTDDDTLHRYEIDHAILLSPDMDFSFVLPPDDPDVVSHTRRMLTLLYEADFDAARAVIFTALASLKEEQTELAYGFRAARLADLGFPPADEAWALYARIDIRAFEAQLGQEKPFGFAELPSRAHLLSTTVKASRTFLSRALEALDAHDSALAQRFLGDFVSCVNRAAMSAPGGLGLKDSERLGELAGQVQDTISLGLESVAKGDLVRAVWILEHAWALQLFQVGHALASQRARRAKGLESRGGSLFGPDLGALLAALSHHPNPLWVLVSDTLPRRFATLGDLADVDARLDAAETMVDVFETTFGFERKRFEAHAFAGIGADDKRFITFETLGATLVAHALLDGLPSLEPLTRAELGRVIEQLDRLPIAVQELASRLDAAARPLLVRAQHALTEGLAGLAGDPDPRFLGGVVLTRIQPDE